MALLVLLAVPHEFQRFAKSDSKKRAFKRIAKDTRKIPRPFLDFVTETTTAIDQRHRTEEAHGNGSARKWNFVYIESDHSNCDLPQTDMFWAWNSLNRFIFELGKVVKQAERAAGQQGAPTTG